MENVELNREAICKLLSSELERSSSQMSRDFHTLGVQITIRSGCFALPIDHIVAWLTCALMGEANENMFEGVVEITFEHSKATISSCIVWSDGRVVKELDGTMIQLFDNTVKPLIEPLMKTIRLLNSAYFEEVKRHLNAEG
jgi:hypothetical protein